MSLRSQILKVIKKVDDKVVAKLDQTASNVTSSLKGAAAVRQRLEDKVAALTPSLAATVLFKVQGGLVPVSVSNASRWRYFSVDEQSLTPAKTGRNSSSSVYDGIFTITVGYPADQTVDVTVSGVTTTYQTADLRAMDTEQLDSLVRALVSPWAAAPAIAGAAEITMLPFVDTPTTRQNRWLIHVTRSWT